MTDYSRLIDAETWAFIERTNSFYAVDAVDHSVAEQRRTYDRMAEAFHAAYPEDVTAETSALQAGGHAIPLRRYHRRNPDGAAVVVYFHGGGFVVGGLESHDDVCAEICAHTGFDVVSVDYRLLPEHPHPAAFDDCLAAFRHVAAEGVEGVPVVLCGDSAGGNLAAAVSAVTRDDARPPVAQVLIYPGLGGNIDAGSYLTHAEAPLLRRDELVYYEKTRSGGRDLSRDVTSKPLADTDFSRLPPTAIFSAECDPLCDDGRDYRDRLVAAGVPAIWEVDAGLVHGWLRARHSVARARAGFARILAAIDRLGHGGTPG
ncbi:MAG: alpha/beta hydrolase [Rubellimicrobium sp.]|nr:alpha/beta hydrolase [Rubellimicrobium sp.]